MNYPHKSDKRFFIILLGPTGVGKTDFSLALASQLSGEIINGDMGQMFAPLAIGTAKPAWQQEVVPHHLFDIVHTLEEAQHLSVERYRRLVESKLTEIHERGNIPLIVGGSGFYLKSLFFPPASFESYNFFQADVGEISWNKLHAIDPVRAQSIHPHDHYRIERALKIWQVTQRLPSSYKPLYSPLGTALVIYCTRSQEELHQRINLRTEQMLAQGWIDEVRSLSMEWQAFLQQKRIIGYPEILAYVRNEISYELLRETIQKNTRAYAKRQATFWRGMQAQLAEQEVQCREINLTLLPLDLYINQLLKDVHEIF